MKKKRSATTTMRPTPKRGVMRDALRECVEVLILSDPDGLRAKNIHAPEDKYLYGLCEQIGYGAVMDSAARLWRLKDPIGAHTVGAAAMTVQRCLKQAKRALRAPTLRKKS